MSIGNCIYQSIGEFLHDKFYHIPDYQREYAWEDDAVEDFLNDLDETTKNPDQDHFFGQIVIHHAVKEKKKYIVDGQQRTITSFIFLKTLSVLCAEIHAENPTEQKLSKRITKIASDIGDPDAIDEDPIHLRLGESDNDFFVENIFEAKKPSKCKASKKSHKLMRDAFTFMYERFKKRLDDLPTLDKKTELINTLYTTLTKHFTIMYMEATEPEEAFVIFETLNARGKDLETADLLKNFIFSHVGSSQIEAAQDNWNKMVEALDGVDKTTYLRHFWNSSKEFTRTQFLYRQISLANKTKDEAFNLVNRLKKYASFYHDLAHPDQANEIDDDVILTHLKNLQTLNAKGFYPIMLAMRQCGRDYTPKDFAMVVKTLENFVFRNATICGKTTNSMEVFMCRTAHKICKKQLDADEICKELAQEIVPDEVFQASFEKLEKKPKNTIRYILRCLNRYYDKENEINLDNKKVQIEHIMPEDNKNWKVNEEDYKKYLWCLGNLTLLSGGLNSVASNNKFEEKIEQYKNSKIALTEKTVLLDPKGKPRTEWTVPDDIIERQIQFAEIAPKIWPRE